MYLQKKENLEYFMRNWDFFNVFLVQLVLIMTISFLQEVQASNWMALENSDSGFKYLARFRLTVVLMPCIEKSQWDCSANPSICSSTHLLSSIYPFIIIHQSSCSSIHLSIHPCILFYLWLMKLKPVIKDSYFTQELSSMVAVDFLCWRINFNMYSDDQHRNICLSLQKCNSFFAWIKPHK